MKERKGAMGRMVVWTLERGDGTLRKQLMTWIKKIKRHSCRLKVMVAIMSLVSMLETIKVGFEDKTFGRKISKSSKHVGV
jgi:hypothetical protein